MMSWGNCFKYAWRINRQRSTLLILIILFLAMGHLINAAMTLTGLYVNMAAPLDLCCTISDTAPVAAEELGVLDGVKYVSEYLVSQQTLSYNGYSVQVKLMGCEGTFLTERFSDSIVTAMDGTMPYIIFDAAVLESMVNEKGETLAADQLSRFLMMNFEIGSVKARLCGITEEAEASESAGGERMLFVYTTLDGYDALNSSALSGSTGTSADTNIAKAAVDNEKNYMIMLKSGFHLSRILNILEKNGIACTYGNDSDQQISWEREQSDALKSLEMSGVMLLCAMILIFYQGQLWKLKHKAFLMYVSLFQENPYIFRRITVCRVLWLMIISIPCTAVWCWINTVLDT